MAFSLLGMAQELKFAPPKADTLAYLKYLDSTARALEYKLPLEAMESALEGLQVSRDAGRDKTEIRFLQRISQIYYIINDLPNALTYALEAEKRSLLTGKHDQLGNIYNAIGNIYFEKEQADVALRYFERSLAERRKKGSRGAIAGSLNNIGRVLLESGDLKKSREYLDEAYLINRETDNWHWQTFNLMNFCLLAQAEEDWDAARNYCDTGLAISQEKNYPISVLELMHLRAETEMLAGEDQAAIKWFREVVAYPAIPGQRGVIAQSHQQLSGLLRKSGDLEGAYQHLEQFSRIQDSVLTSQTQSEVSNVRFRAKLDSLQLRTEFDQRNALLRQEKALKEAQLTSGLYSMGAICLLVVAGALFLAYRSKKRLNERLKVDVKTKSQRLEETSQELNHFIYKSSHELHGPITSIQGLLNLYREDPDMKVAHLVQEKVDLLETQHRLLIHIMELRNRTPISQPVDLENVVQSCLNSLKAQLRREDLPLDWKQANIPSFQSDPWIIGIVLQAILEHAFFLGKGPAPIQLETRLAGQELLIEVKSPGIPEDPHYEKQVFKMFFRTPQQQTGLYAARMAAQKLGGTLILSLGENHTRFQAVVPVAAS